jgi:hypothetical protein
MINTVLRLWRIEMIIHDFFNPTFLSHECMGCSSFYDLICKVQGPGEVDMFSGNLEVVSLGGRIWHILQLQVSCDRRCSAARCSAGAISCVAADQAFELWAR